MTIVRGYEYYPGFEDNELGKDPLKWGKKKFMADKIPNNHSNIMKETKSKFIAQSLKLGPGEFNDLIKCPLKGFAPTKQGFSFERKKC